MHPPSDRPLRKIIHIDMDAFYAAVEQRDFPEYRGRPVVVGGMPDSRGVVSTCSYEARPFGIRSAMPSAQAYRLCPQAIFVRPRFEAYREVSRQIHDILRQFSDLVEPVSLDEAYLDVTGCAEFRGSAALIAQEIKVRIHRRTDLTASAGVSYNKFLAKIASDLNKPDGLCLITPKRAVGLIEELPIGRFHGIGKATEARMKAMGIHCGRDLKACSQADLLRHFGKAGGHYYRVARGIDERPVVPQRPRKSFGSEVTFQQDLSDRAELLDRLAGLTQQTMAELGAKGLRARTVTLKVRYADFELVTRSKTMSSAIAGSWTDLLPHLQDLLDKTDAERRRVRLLGISFSAFNEPGAAVQQLDLFSDEGI